MIKIGNQSIADGQPCYVIAEAGVNHNGRLDLALELVKQAKEAGADCVKFQTFKAERVVTKESPKAAYQLKVTSQKESQLDMLRKLELRSEDYQKIIEFAKECGIHVLSTPYNEEDADFLESLGFDAFKIASGQLVELAFLKHLAAKKRPLILSTGMGTLAEVSEAVETIRGAGNEQMVILQCTTNYPSDLNEANIKAMITMKNALNVQVGYSDHIPEDYACFAAVALGATVIEKHFTLDKNMDGPDHSSSLDVQEFTHLVEGIRKIERSLGNGVKEPSVIEIENAKGMRRSIVSKKPIGVGEVLTYENLCFKRPATGIAPKEIDKIVGKKLRLGVREDELINYKHIDW